MLVALARCAGCGAAMIRNSGKGGTYLYYACSRAMKQGKNLVCFIVRLPISRIPSSASRVLSGGKWA